MSKVIKKVGKGLKKVVKKVGKVAKKALPVAALALGGFGLAGMGPLGGMLGGVGSSMGTAIKGFGSRMFGGGLSTASGMGMSGMGPQGGMDNRAGGGGFMDKLGGFFGGGSGGRGGGFGSMAMAGLDAYGSYRQGKEGQSNYRQAFETANPFAQHRPGFGNQLVDFMQDPNSIAQTPGYKFAMEQGTKAMNRTSAAKGERVSGRALVEAQRFGGGLASQMRQQEINNLSNLSGANMGFGGGQYGAEAGNQYYGGLQEAAGTIGHAMGYGKPAPDGRGGGIQTGYFNPNVRF